MLIRNLYTDNGNAVNLIIACLRVVCYHIKPDALSVI